MYIDAHFHIDDLMEYVANVSEHLARANIAGIASCHSLESFETTAALINNINTNTMTASFRNTTSSSPCIHISFGIHPQAVSMSLVELITDLAHRNAIRAIGECGFDFYGDRPGCMLNDTNLSLQKEAFEAQLDFAERFGLPIIIHARKAESILFQYTKQLAKLRAVIFHSWNKSPQEARDLLRHIPEAYFSIGTSIVNGNKKTFASAGTLPLTHILTESDAPWQPPRLEPVQGSPVIRPFSSQEDIPRIISFITAARELNGTFVPGFWLQQPDSTLRSEIINTISNNFERIFNEHI